MHITICDDEPKEILYLKTLLAQWAMEQSEPVTVDSYPSAEAFLFAYEEKKKLDILLLDIQMGELDGVSLAKKIREQNDQVQIIFITGFPDFMAEGYEVAALHYLMKPVNPDKLFRALDRAVKNLTKTEPALFLAIDGEVHRVLLSEIRVIEAQGHYIHMKTTTAVYRQKRNLSDLLEELDGGFFRCQRSFIVGLRYVKRITRTGIILEDGEEVPLSRDLYDAANRAVIDFFP